jgi:hypothetical protein
MAFESPAMEAARQLEVQKVRLDQSYRDLERIAGPLAATAQLRARLDELAKPPAVAQFLAGLDQLTEAYSGSLVMGATSLSPHWIWEAPPLYAYTGTRVAGAIAGWSQGQAVASSDDDAEEAITDVATTLVTRLASVGPEFLEPYLGAQTAMTRREADWIRHVCASLRELEDKLILHLAPNSAMESWIPAPDADDIVEGTWSRKARLRYIFRAARVGGTERMVDEIINTTLMVFFPENAGVHTLVRPHNDAGMELLFAHAQGQLHTILRAARY